MFDKTILTLMMSLILLGVAMIAIPFPILWGMGCLFFLALSVILRRQGQA